MVTTMTLVVGIATVLALAASFIIAFLQLRMNRRSEKARDEAQARSIGWWFLPEGRVSEDREPINFLPKHVESDLFEKGEYQSKGSIVINNPSTAPVNNSRIVSKTGSEYIGVIAPGRIAYWARYPNYTGSASERFDADFEDGKLMKYLEFKDHRDVLWRLQPGGTLERAPKDAEPGERPTS